MLFSQVVGQEKLKQDLIQLVDNKQFPHALMFLGNEGWGTLPMALAFVQYLMCEQRNGGDACNVCANCIKIQKFEHPDVRASYPSILATNHTKNYAAVYIEEFRSFIQQTPYGTTYDWLHLINTDGKKQGNISAHECREIVDGMNLKAYEGGYKVHIIWRPEYLDSQGNILLKLIEEPPADTLLIFVATDAKRILPTLLSRMQAFKLKPLSIEEISSALQVQKSIPADKAMQVASLSNGDYSEALVQSQGWDNESLPLITEMLNAVYANNGLVMHEWVEKMADMSKEAIRQHLKYFQMLFSAGFRLSIHPQIPVQLAEADAAFVHKLAKLQLPMTSYAHIDKGLNDLSYNIGRNASVKVQLFHFCIQMQYWIKGRKLSI